MRKSVLLVCLVAGSMLAGSPVALAADSWLGTWKLNLSRSKFSPGPAPRSQTVKFEPAEGGFTFTSDTVDPQGQSTQGGYTARFDGKDYVWNNNASADTVALKRLDDHSYENTWKKSGKVTITSKVVVSRDGKVLTNTQTGKNAKGEDVNHILIFEKQ